MSEEISSDRFQLLCGVSLGILAAIMAINSIGGERWGAEEIKAANQISRVYAWYQSKSIKESLIESHRDNVIDQLAADGIKGGQLAALKQDLGRLNAELARYEREKREIIEGSDGVGKENWMIEQNGELGKVEGARDWERTLKLYEDAGDVFDFSAIFLNISIVLGSLSLLMSRPAVRNSFFTGMLGFGLVGSWYLAQAFVMVGSF